MMIFKGLRASCRIGSGLALTLALGSACKAPPPPVAATPTALPVLEQAFGEAFFEPATREALLSREANAELVLPARLEPNRYRFLQILEMRRLADDQRAAAVGVAIDGWPLRLDVLMARKETGWRVASLAHPQHQAVWLDLLGPEGLPTSAHADPWRGGLAGRDATGRPTAAAVLVAVDQQVWVDGEVLPNDEGRVVDALRRVLTARGALAQRLERAWSPQVALVVPGNDAGSRHALLTEWAVAAGAEGVLLVVRGTQGGPATLPMALRGPRPPGPNPPPVVEITREGAELRFTLNGLTEALPTVGGVADEGAVTRMVSALVARRPSPVGGVLNVGVDVDHARTVAVMDAWRAAAPDLPLASRP